MEHVAGSAEPLRAVNQKVKYFISTYECILPDKNQFLDSPYMTFRFFTTSEKALSFSKLAYVINHGVHLLSWQPLLTFLTGVA